MSINNSKLDESSLEQTALAWFENLGYNIAFGPDISPDGEKPERADYAKIVLEERFKSVLLDINPEIPENAIDEAVKKSSFHEPTKP